MGNQKSNRKPKLEILHSLTTESEQNRIISSARNREIGYGGALDRHPAGIAESVPMARNGVVTIANAA